ncbi:MAG: DDE-type integrase/transposase/recombinase [Streptosporangiaceae bacterium]
MKTWDGWAYLATVIDLYSRKVVGWAIAAHMRSSLIIAALDMAIADRRPPAGVIFHSDCGCQGGFNWSSQHLDHGGGGHGTSGGLDDGVDGPFVDEVSRGAVVAAGGRAGVLA